MRIYATFIKKGGSGKTTLTVHLAVVAQLAGEKVAVLGADEQGSAESWARVRTARGESFVPVATVTPSSIADAIEAARHDGYTLVLIDVPPVSDSDANRILHHADAVLIPVRPSAFDLDAISATVATVSSVGVPMAAVLNACPPRAPEINEARALLEQNGLPILAMLHERRAFSRAVSTGRAVVEFEPCGKAAAEIAALWRALQ